MDSTYTLVERIPTNQEYRGLCTAVGWERVMNFEAAKVAVPNSQYAVVVERDGRAVGMGRVVGDGAIFYYIQDLAVDPAHQGRGIGSRILQTLLDYIRRHAPDQAFVGLFAAEGTTPFYAQYGFQTHPALTGMFAVTPLDELPHSDPV